MRFHTLPAAALLVGSMTTAAMAYEVNDTNKVTQENGVTTTEEIVVRNDFLLDDGATIVANAQKVENLSTLVDAVVAAGLADDLMGEGPFTVLAPMNSAFEALPEGTVEDLLKPENQEQLVAVLQRHVLMGEFASERVRDEIELIDSGEEFQAADIVSDDGIIAEEREDVAEFQTLSGEEILLQMVGGNLYVVQPGADPIEVVVADIQTSNGIVHVIDGVIVN